MAGGDLWGMGGLVPKQGQNSAEHQQRPQQPAALPQLRLVDLRNFPLQLLRVFGEELELGAVAFRVLPGVVVPNLGWGETGRVRNSSVTQPAARTPAPAAEPVPTGRRVRARSTPGTLLPPGHAPH